jgi:hypothetical protein
MAITLGVFAKQFHYDPSVLTPRQTPVSRAVEEISKSPSLWEFSDLVPSAMIPMNALETFGPETLSDKINGKAELYLSAGFVGLQCQRFALKADPNAWMEIYVYDMATLRQAFGVFSMQRRADVTSADLTPFSYRTKNALFYVHGRYYVENIASMASGAMMESMESFAKDFVKKPPGPQEEIGELTLFPKDHLEEATMTLSISNVFGFDGMKNVFTGTYHMAGEELTGFLTHTGSSENAQNLMEAYTSFLVANGGSQVPLDIALTDGVLVKIFDTFELFFRHGPYVAGVHEAETQQGAERLGLMLSGSLTGIEQ